MERLEVATICTRWDRLRWYDTAPPPRPGNRLRLLIPNDSISLHGDAPYRTADMSYLVYRELLLPLGKWYDQVETARNQYAKRYVLAARTDTLDWENYETSTHRGIQTVAPPHQFSTECGFAGTR
jgi:hypothetical protein